MKKLVQKSFPLTLLGLSVAMIFFCLASTPAHKPFQASISSNLSASPKALSFFNRAPRSLPATPLNVRKAPPESPKVQEKDNGFSFFVVMCWLVKKTLQLALIIFVLSLLQRFFMPEKKTIVPHHPFPSLKPEICPNRVCYDAIFTPEYQRHGDVVVFSIDDSFDYGEEEAASLALVDHYIRNLTKEPNHNKIVLFLSFERSNQPNVLNAGLDVPMTILNALRFYKKKRRNTQIVAYSPSFEPKSYLVASHAHLIYTNKNTPLYLPWAFLHKKLNEYCNSGKPYDQLNEDNLSDQISIRNEGDKIIAGQYKMKIHDKDAIALFKKTVIDVFSCNVMSRQVKLFSIGTAVNFFQNIKQLFFSSSVNILEGYHSITYKNAYRLNLFDGCDKTLSYSSFLESSRVDYSSRTLPTSNESISSFAIDIVYVKGEFKHMEEARDFTCLFEWLAKKDFVKGVVLLIDSPGGLMSYVQSFAAALTSLRKAKPLVAYTQKDCCSGAYLVASYCHYIVAQKTARVGSIGVISTFSSSFILTEQDKKTHVKELANNFIETVATNRHQQVDQPIETYKKSLIKTQARTFPAVTAKKKGLIDFIGDLHAAIRILRQLITDQNKIKGDSCKVFYHEPL